MTTPDRTEEFVRLQTRYQQRVFSFILTLVPHWADAEEVLQETNTILWRKFDQFDPSSDFVRWANQVAYFEVQKFRKRQGREPSAASFSDEVFERVADDTREMTDRLSEQRDALQFCLERLTPQDRRLVDLRYFDEATPQSVADEVNRPVESVYKSLQRIRRSLLECIRRATSREDRP